MSDNLQRPEFTRRRLLKSAALVGSAACALTPGASAAAPPDASPAGGSPTATSAAPSRVAEENARAGADDWQLTRVRLDHTGGFRSPKIEGYCSHRSITAGERMQVMVSMDPPGEFTLEIFRTGYYGGRGARLMQTLGPFSASTEEVPPQEPDTHLRQCQWKAALEFVIPNDWLSGVYLGRLTTAHPADSSDYWQSYIVFVVRDDRPADILLQCSDNTWQAYNQWPATDSLYTHPKGVQGPWGHVSFDRPYAKYAQIYDNPQSVGSGEWLCFEFPLAYWLEQHGYDVTYCCNADLLTPECGLRARTFISVGHDEYWDRRQYDSVVAMRDAGVNLLFLSGNSVCWVSPLRTGSTGRENRILFRGGPYGGDYRWAEGRHRDHGPFPERGPDEGYLIGARNVEPVNGGGDFIITAPDHWIYEGTGVKQGDRIPGLIGWEYHGDPPSDLPGLEVVAEGVALQGGTVPQRWAATLYPGPRDNFVFNASTIFWVQGLSSPPGHMLPWSHWSRPHGPDRRVQQITANLLRRAGATPHVAP